MGRTALQDEAVAQLCDHVVMCVEVFCATRLGIDFGGELILGGVCCAWVGVCYVTTIYVSGVYRSVYEHRDDPVKTSLLGRVYCTVLRMLYCPYLQYCILAASGEDMWEKSARRAPSAEKKTLKQASNFT